MPKEISEIFKDIAEFTGGDQVKVREFVTEFRKHDGAKPVAQELINIGNGGKAAELGPKITKLEADLKTANETIAAKDGEIDTIKNEKSPDRKKIEEEVGKAFQTKLDTEKAARLKAEGDAKALRKRVAVDAFVRELTTPDEQGVRIEEGWARRVVAADHDDRFDEAEDGTQRVLQIGGTLPYDGKHEEQIKALAKEARKKVPALYQVTGQDRGSGLGTGTGTGTGGSYDPVKTGEAMGRAQKQEGSKNLAYQ